MDIQATIVMPFGVMKLVRERYLYIVDRRKDVNVVSGYNV